MTKELRFRTHEPVSLEEVKAGVDRFLLFARESPDWVFNVSPIGCGLAGFSPNQIAPLFVEHPDNVFLPEIFKAQLELLRNG